MQLPILEIPVIIRPDENGIFDGREIASQLIQTAFQAIIPYANACPGCSDALFSAIANDALTELHQQGRDAGSLKVVAKLWATQAAEAAGAAGANESNQLQARHFGAAHARTRELLEQHEAMTGHCH